MGDVSFAAELAAERVVAFPTETVYGLGANCCSDKAVSSVFKLKGRPSDNPLIVHVATIAAVTSLSGSEPPPQAIKLMDAFWPGPLAIILPLTPDSPISKLVTAGLTTAAFRMPKHPAALNLLQSAASLGVQGVAAPSANKSGRPSPTSAAHVAQDFQNENVPIMQTDIPCECGLESTVLDLSRQPPCILRHGAVTASAIKQQTGIEVLSFHQACAEAGGGGEPSSSSSAAAAAVPKAPGMKYRHYAPKATLILCEGGGGEEATEGGGKAGPGNESGGGKAGEGRGGGIPWDAAAADAGARALLFDSSPARSSASASTFPPQHILSLGASVKEASQRVFALLRACDDADATTIYVDISPVLAAGEEGYALLDRLRKAAAG
eukprot:CAMPEP_0181320246 /NCGR_PEP_ID=MMETSP1101-20121128/18015_1 /TAXON_ID=46948 /ORGANISM="Rhodomonas abbreviata, Strain Caron Lab Isolate" /LENGTH=379 /DNA_ID=CAMNT_0023427925 /DNA_START=159 /DNA_END=1298 /DNA_ORIENTATION=+